LINDLKIVTFRAINFNLKLNYELLSRMIFRKVLIYVDTLCWCSALCYKVDHLFRTGRF